MDETETEGRKTSELGKKMIAITQAILREQKLDDWAVAISTAGGYCWRTRKLIHLPVSAMSLGIILHEIAHAQTEDCRGDQHHGLWADRFTRLVDQYCVLRHWIVSPAKCRICGHSWTLVYPEDAKNLDSLPCPNCENPTGEAETDQGTGGEQP